MAVLDQAADQLAAGADPETLEWSEVCDLDRPACAFWATDDAPAEQKGPLFDAWLGDTERDPLMASAKKKCEASFGTWHPGTLFKKGYCEYKVFPILPMEPAEPLEPIPLPEGTSEADPVPAGEAVPDDGGAVPAQPAG